MLQSMKFNSRDIKIDYKKWRTFRTELFAPQLVLGTDTVAVTVAYVYCRIKKTYVIDGYEIIS